jgi:hypothetical protein
MRSIPGGAITRAQGSLIFGRAKQPAHAVTSFQLNGRILITQRAGEIIERRIDNKTALARQFRRS